MYCKQVLARPPLRPRDSPCFFAVCDRVMPDDTSLTRVTLTAQPHLVVITRGPLHHIHWENIYQGTDSPTVRKLTLLSWGVAGGGGDGGARF